MLSNTYISRPAGRDAVVLGGAYLYLPVWRTDLFRQERTGASATTLCGDGDPVGSARALGTAGGWGIAPSDAARPTLTKSGNLWYLDYSSANDRLDWTFSPAITPSAVCGGAAFRPNTAITAYERVLSATNSTNVDWDGDNRCGFILRDNTNTAWNGTRNSTAAAAITISNGVDTLMDSTFDATNHEAFMNATTNTTTFADKGSFSFDSLSLGGQKNGTEYFRGRIYGFYFYTRFPSTSERTGIRSHVGRWAGLSI